MEPVSERIAPASSRHRIGHRIECRARRALARLTISRSTIERGSVMLELRHLSKSYAGGHPVLADLSWRFRAGEFVAIMGDSGVGKSTLLNLIAGLDTPDPGPEPSPVRIDGRAMSALDDAAATRLRRARMGFIFQAFHVLPHLSLLQNVALPLLLNGLPQERAQAMLDAVGLGRRAHDFPHQLSGGETQRVAIARALVHRPALVLADEPTGNLDPDTAHGVLLLLRAEIRNTGACALIVTHSHAAAKMADRTLLLTKSGLQEQ
jgi:putative ABC transport system ATP-binding protein